MDGNLPGCSKESVGYVLECGTCRQEGRKRWYCGETSRSAAIRGAEHMRDVMEGNLSHPFVKHAWEEHEGEQPEIIMRIISKHESTMDRQLTEAVRISRMFGGDMSENLNAKAEWGILRTSTIGIMIQRTEGKMRVKQEEWQEGTRKERSNRENETGVRRSGGKNESNEEMKGKRKLWKPRNEKENPHDHVKRKKITEKDEEEEKENE